MKRKLDGHGAEVCGKCESDSIIERIKRYGTITERHRVCKECGHRFRTKEIEYDEMS